MDNKDKQRKIIYLLIFLIPLLCLIGIGIYKFKYMETLFDENPLIEEIEEVVKSKPPKKENMPIVPDIEEVQTADTSSEMTIEEGIETEKMDEAKAEQEAEPASAEKKELTTIYIPLTQSLFKKSDVSENSFTGKPRLTQTQREELKIDEIKTELNMKNIPSEDLVPGKLYYRGENGKLESFVYVNPNGKIHEYLIAYDPKGNYVDCIETGLITTENGKVKYASISINKLSVFELQPGKQSGKKEEIVTEYSINPQLQFKKGKTFIKVL
jgi:hypothetical protein